MTESKTFCALPWLHRFTNEQGFHQLCCTGDGPLNQLRDAQGKALNISQGLTDEQVLNSPDLKAVRLGMLEGKWPVACERCRQSESAGAKSIRNHMNDQFRHHVDRVLENTAQDGTLTAPQVIYADIRLGNVCNLTCRMCGPGASRLWADHYNEVQPKRYSLPVEKLKDLRVNNWVKRQSVQWLIEQCLPSVENLHFAGGEPLIIPEMVELLETCIESGRASQIMLSYNTNITVLPEKVTRLWPHFKSVSVMCSVDAIGPLNDYIRRPSRWSEIDRNLRRLDEHYQEWNLRKAHFNTTVQIYNVLHLADFFDYLADNLKNFDPVPQFTPLYGPGYLSIVNLPDRIKAIARERLIGARAKAELRLGMTSNLSSVDTILAHMETPGHRMLLAEFFYFSEKTDREFNESWHKACPELDQLLTARA